MSFFPTNAGKTIAKKVGIGKHLPTELDLGSAISDFQRMAAIDESLEDCLIVFDYWVEKGLTKEQLSAMELIYEITKREVNGIIFEKVADVINSSKDNIKLDAARLLSDLKNGDDSSKGNTVKKIIFELDKKADQ